MDSINMAGTIVSTMTPDDASIVASALWLYARGEGIKPSRKRAAEMGHAFHDSTFGDPHDRMERIISG